MIIRKCSECQIQKPISQFSKNRTRKYGHAYICRQCQKIYRIANKDHISKIKKEWRKKNQSQIKERKAKYHQENKEWCKIYRDINKDKIKKISFEYHRSNQGQMIARKNKLKRRARLTMSEVNDLTTKQIKSMLKNATRCSICNKTFNSRRKKTLDHIIALSKGGNNTSMNIQVVCLSCNLIKGVKDYTEFNGGQRLLFV